MGLFSRKKSEAQLATQPSVPGIYPWQLAPSESNTQLTDVDAEALELILEQSGSPSRNQQVPVSVTAVGDQSLAVHWDGSLMGHVEGPEAVPYVQGLRHLQSTNRFAVTKLTVASRKSKYHGTSSIAMPYSGRPFVPFNQPSEDLPFIWIDPTIKDERFHIGQLRALAPAHKTPGWFILRPTADGEVIVYVQPYGSNSGEVKVGAVIKDHQAATTTGINNSPAYTFGRVYWYDNGPDIRLGL